MPQLPTQCLVLFSNTFHGKPHQMLDKTCKIMHDFQDAAPSVDSARDHAFCTGWTSPRKSLRTQGRRILTSLIDAKSFVL